MRFRFLFLLLLIGGGWPGSLPECPAAEAGRRPNILVIVADDLGYGELSCQGNPEIPTPNIDSIARQGVRFTNGYVTAPVCSPSRAGFMTGRYQSRFGHELNAIGKQNLEENIGLPVTEITLADRLKAAGYATGAVGKWHLGGQPRFQPQQRGFDEFFGFLQEGHFYAASAEQQDTLGVTSFLRTNQLPAGSPSAPGAGAGAGSGTRWVNGRVIWSTHLRSNEPQYDEENPILRGTQPVDEREYLTDAFTREAVAFLDRHAKQPQPFFLYLPYNAPHSPMQGMDRYLKRFAGIADIHRRIFAAMVTALDEGIGRVLARVRERGIEDDTLIFFFSDNGGPTQELTSSNLPLSGGKGTLQEGGIRIPFMVQWKNHLPAGRVYDPPVISLDIPATALAAAHAAPPGIAGDGRGRLDGIDLLPYLSGRDKTAPHEFLYWRYGRAAAIRKGNWKLFRPNSQQPWHLYDLAGDVAEAHDLAAAQPETVKELDSAWTQWNSQLVPPLWGAGPGKKNGK